jgi:hypothetical protein
LNTKEILETVLSLCVVAKPCKDNGQRQVQFLMVRVFIPLTIEKSKVVKFSLDA